MATEDQQIVMESQPQQRAELNVDESDVGVVYYIMAGISFIFIILFFPFSLLYTIKIVTEYERAVILRLGRLSSRKAKGPGLFFVIPCTDTVNKVDLRTISLDIPPQEILTKDSVTVRVDAVVFYRVYNPTMSILNVENVNSATYFVAQTTLRNVLGTKKLSELLTDRDAIGDEMQQILDEATDPWGVKVERVEIKDVSLPQQLQRAMAAEAEASREARAKVISAEGEQNASRVLRDAANIMDESPASLQLRYLQTLNTIAAYNNHTYVFPLPVDLMMKLVSGVTANNQQGGGGDQK
ncbi:PREDICTED: erythrocyte band 7 integral membrane protein-like [Amphimedon queenslandica]|nr:PREDICTED: erythrocyte band 7 integral membrane protein-like [Amphimedon queenslandica]|eukprot:XP_003387046.1 PREDICTED: erythrocyte band 7 integral membrane protein-like [Amphimedon queenslandica]